MHDKNRQSSGDADRLLKEIRQELGRLQAGQTTVEMDEDFEPEAGMLAKVTVDRAYWHLLPERLLTLLRELPDGAGSEDIKKVIESKENLLWRGPAPENARDV